MMSLPVWLPGAMFLQWGLPTARSASKVGSASSGVCLRGGGADPARIRKQAVHILLECFLVSHLFSFPFAEMSR